MDRVTSVTQPSADGIASGLVTSYSYNVLGQRTKVTLPDSSETDYEYYPTGELKKVSGSQSYTVEYTYDPQGRKATMTTHGQAGPATTSWQYHAQRGWLTGKRYDNNEGPDYTYNAAGKLLTRTWARGISTSYSYNRAGDLTGVSYSDSTPAISYQYDHRGRRIETVDDSGTRAFTYHSSGSLSTETYTSGTLEGYSLEHGYDGNHRRNALTLKQGATTLLTQGYSYGAASRLAGITSGAESIDYSYHANSPLISEISFKRSSSEVMKTTRSYDFNNRLTETKTEAGMTTLSRHEYHFTNLNQRNRVNLSDGGYWLYQYNTKGEVTKGERYDQFDTKVPGYELGYSFDGIGNREESTLDGVLKETYTANELNQYTEIEAAGAPNPRAQLHDADGNLTDDNVRLYTYNGENRLIEVREKSSNALIATYHYDDQGRRYRKVTTAAAPQGAIDSLYLWDDWNNLWESNDGATLSTAARVWGLDLTGSEQGAGGVGGLLLQRIDSDAHFFTYDGNGNASRLVDTTSGTIAAAYEYGPFGEVIASTGTHANINRSQFSTKYSDEETSFLYYGYRYYASEAGRWLNRDPIEERGGLNVYGFVNNCPISLFDVLGLDGTWCISVNNDIGSNLLERPVVSASYTMSEEQKRCCSKFKIKRTAKGFLSKSDDDDPDGGVGNRYQPGNSTPDQPGGTYGIGPQLIPLTMRFTWTAVCIEGPLSGKELSRTERDYKLRWRTGNLIEPSTDGGMNSFLYGGGFFGGMPPWGFPFN